MRSSLGLFAWLLLTSANSADLPTVASINLCTDQLVLAIADPAQILTVSWLAADAEESMLAESAAKHTLNYGSGGKTC